MKKIIITVMETLICYYDENLKNDVIQKVRQLNHQTVARRLCDISHSIKDSLILHLKN